jgi:putative flavoprotein involved in K+ transport
VGEPATGGRLLGVVTPVDVVIIGAGQAGLATSYELTRRGIEHVVLERGRVAQTWRDRWDSFCIVTPNWTIQLPGAPYEGPDPDGFMLRDEFVALMERYAATIAAPVREGVEVTAIAAAAGGGFTLATSAGELCATRVVLAVGAFQRPHRPTADALPRSLEWLDVPTYRNPGVLPEGGVLIVGAGQSALQLAEELHAAGRDVVVACGRAPWLPRRLGDRDIVWWALETGFLDTPVEALPEPADRLTANLQTSGHHGGHSLHFRTVRDLGVTLAGRFLGTSDGHLEFADDLAASVAWGDEKHGLFMDLVRRHVVERGMELPEIEAPEPFAADAPTRLSVDRFGSVIFASGFRPAYRDWLPWPDAFDDLGFPIHRDGASTVVPGLHFVGVHFLRKRKSSSLLGVAEDSAVVAQAIADASGGPPPSHVA